MKDLSSEGHFSSESISPWKSMAHLIRLSNQTGTLLLLLPTLWSLFLASKGQPSWFLIMIFILGSFLMRSAGVIMNDLADRSFDRRVQRTKLRPLAAGTLSIAHAYWFLFILLGGSACLLWFLSPLAITLSPIAILLAGIYPFCKRYIHIPQLVLGLAFGWGGVMAWATVTNEVGLSTCLLFLATACWAVVYDTIYAIQDMEDDRLVGVRSSAIYFGSKLWVGVGVAGLGMVGCLIFVGMLNHLNTFYFLILILVVGFLVGQVWRLRSPLLPSQAFAMFKQHCWIGSLMLLGIILGVK